MPRPVSSRSPGGLDSTAEHHQRIGQLLHDHLQQDVVAAKLGKRDAEGAGAEAVVSKTEVSEALLEQLWGTG